MKRQVVNQPQNFEFQRPTPSTQQIYQVPMEYDTNRMLPSQANFFNQYAPPSASYQQKQYNSSTHMKKQQIEMIPRKNRGAPFQGQVVNESVGGVGTGTGQVSSQGSIRGSKVQRQYEVFEENDCSPIHDSNTSKK